MIKEKIEKYFRQYPQLRVLFFFDPTGEFLQEVEALDLQDIRVERWQNNSFTLKTKLHGDWKMDKVFLYFPQAHPRTTEEYHNFPLLDLLIANKELMLDNVGEFMEEHHLQRHQKSLVNKYMRELKNSTVLEVCRPILNAGNFTEPALIQGVVSAFLKFRQIESWPLLIGKLLTYALPDQHAELAKVEKRMTALDIVDSVREKIRELTGVAIQQVTPEALNEVLRSVLYNKITQSLTAIAANDPYRKYRIEDPGTLIAFSQMLNLVAQNGKLNEKFQEALENVSKDIQGATLIQAYGADAGFAYFHRDMIWAMVSLQQKHLSVSPDSVIRSLEELYLQDDHSAVIRDSLTYLLQTARMHQQINRISSYILNRPEDYLAAYTQEWYLIDAFYRKATEAFRRLDTTEIPEQINLHGIYEQANYAYEKHLDTMNREWLTCLAQFNFDYAQLPVPKQYDFYQTEVEPADQKVVVIISDAMRYEVAHELLSEMHGDNKNTADIRYQLASIPSITSVGMAQLLPGKEFTFNDGDISIDCISTSGIDNRQKILLARKENAAAVQYSDIAGLNMSDARELFKKPVVYVYHDVIDSTGDKKPSERRVFAAVAEAISELKTFVKKLHASYNVAKVFVTSDHGFLYNDRELEEKDKENTVNKNALVNHNRFEIGKKNPKVDAGYQFPLSITSKFIDDLFVTIPQSVNRYKKQGVGHQFVHGGGSLQELVVPVIQSSRREVAVTQKVKPLLLQANNLRIVSNILRINILQEKKVSRFEKEAIISVGIYKELQLVSNEMILNLASTAEAATERSNRVELTIFPEVAQEPLLKLKVFYQEDMLNPIIEELVQNNTLIQADF